MTDANEKRRAEKKIETAGGCSNQVRGTADNLSHLQNQRS